MKYITVISTLCALMLALASMSIYADQGKGSSGPKDHDQQMDRDRDYDKDRDRDKDMSQDKDQARDRDRLDTQDPERMSDQEIYGGELMTVEERNRYREQLRRMETEEERLKFQAQHL